MSKADLAMGTCIVVMVLGAWAFSAMLSPPAAVPDMQGSCGNQTCKLTLCTEKKSCISFPLSYENCSVLEYLCVKIIEYRDRVHPESATWQDGLGYGCRWQNETCWCVQGGFP